MKGENGVPETPEWHLPPRETEQPELPRGAVLGEN